MIQGIDSRYWNGVLPPGYPCKFAGIKISEGTRTDLDLSMPLLQWKRCPDQDISRLPFHFWRGSRVKDPTEHGKAQANHFFKEKMKEGYNIGELPPAIDVEDRWAQKGLRTVTNIKACLEETQRLWGRKPLIYTAGWWWDSWCKPYADYWADWSPYDYSLWEADPPPDTPCGRWTKSCITQVQLDATVAGFNARIDVNLAEEAWYYKHTGEVPVEKVIKMVVPSGVRIDITYEG